MTRAKTHGKNILSIKNLNFIRLEIFGAKLNLHQFVKLSRTSTIIFL